jgi:hypothetical protein
MAFCCDPKRAILNWYLRFEATGECRCDAFQQVISYIGNTYVQLRMGAIRCIIPKLLYCFDAVDSTDSAAGLTVQ